MWTNLIEGLTEYYANNRKLGAIWPVINKNGLIYCGSLIPTVITGLPHGLKQARTEPNDSLAAGITRTSLLKDVLFLLNCVRCY